MNIYDFIKTGGQETVPNPAYNPKSKKNKVPATITRPQLTPTVDNAVNMAIVDFNNQYSITAKENEKYAKHGLNYNPRENMDVQLAEVQSTWTKWGNGIAQTLVSELLIGIPKGASDLIDFIGQSVGLSSPDYTNPVSQFLEQKQEEFKEFAPVYADPRKNIFNGGLTDAGWWASNMPSIASTLTLLIPATGVTKLGKVAGIGKAITGAKRYLNPVTKAIAKTEEANRLRAAGATAEEIAKAGKLTFWQKALTSPKITDATNTFIETTTTAALSRTMENYQEARQTYNDVYLQASEVFKNMSEEDYQKVLSKNKMLLDEAKVDKNNRDEVAKAIAKKSADETFRIDFLNIGWDVLQLYALRGLFTGKGIEPGKSASVRRAQKDALEYPNKTAQEIAAIKSKRSFKDKAKDWLEDRAYSSKLVLGAELSEGAEEALNYVAQQEGIHLGNVLTGQINENHNTGFWGNVLSGFDGRLKDYVAAPALWDSAFWGVLGGVVFQGVGSKAKQIAQKWGSHSDLSEAERKQLPWYQFDELPQHKAMITEIQNRGVKAQEYKAKLDLINNNINPALSTAERQVHFSSPIEQEFARKQLQKEFTESLMLDAMQVGTGDMLKAYFANDNVRKMFIEAGMFDEYDQSGNKVQKTEQELDAESKRFVEETLQHMDKVEDMYNEEVNHIANIVGAINYSDKNKKSIPVEYIQIIANNNIRRRLAGEIRDNTIANVSARADELRTNLTNNGTLDKDIDYENAYKIEAYANELGRLRAERKRLLEKQDKELTDRIAIKNIEKQIDFIEVELKKAFDAATLSYIIHRSLQYILNDDGSFTVGNTKDAEAYDKHIISQTERMLEDDRNVFISDNYVNPYFFNPLSLEDVGKTKTIKSDIDAAFDHLNNNAKTLAELYSIKFSNELSKNILNSELTNTKDDILEYATMLNNTMDEARVKAVNEAYNSIREIYKTDKDATLDAIEKIANGESIEDIQGLTDENKAKLKSSIDVLAVSQKKNEKLIDHIFNTLYQQDLWEEKHNLNNPGNNQGTSTPTPAPNGNTNGTPAPNTTPAPSSPAPANPPSNPASQSPQPSQPTNPSSQPQSPGTAAPNGSQGQPQSQIDSQKIYNRQLSFRQTPNAIGNLEGSYPMHQQVDFYDNNDGTLTVDTSSMPSTFKDNTLYENADSIDLLNGKPVIEHYPIVRRNNNGSYSVIEKGKVRIDNQVPQGGQSNQGTSTPAPTATAPSTPAAPPTTKPSTGELDNRGNSSNQGQTSQDDDLSRVRLDSSTQLVMDANRAFSAIYKNHASTDFSDFDAVKSEIDQKATELINRAVSDGLDRNTAEAAVNKSKNWFINRINARRQNSSTTMSSTVDEVLIAQTELEINRNETNVVSAYRQAMYNMLDQYIIERGLEKYDGKGYISLEDLLRYINSSTNDASMATTIFNSLKEHLLSDEAKQKYVVIDEADINKTNFWDNIGKSIEERNKEREQEADIQSVDLDRVIRETQPNSKEREETLQAIEALKPGDELNVEVDNDKNTIYLKNENDVRVGSMVIPSIDNATGNYVMNNQGIHYDINPNNNGSFNSYTYDFLLDIFNPKDNASKEFLSILYELAFSNPNTERRKELINKFKENEKLKEGKQLDVFLDDDYETAKGLVSLIRFIKNLSSDTLFNTSNTIILRQSLNSWFDKLISSYDIATDIAHNPNSDYRITVNSVGLGEVIRAQEKVNLDDVSSLPTPDKAIAGGVNTNVNKIAIADPININTIMVSGLPNQQLRGVTIGSTFVLIPDGYGTNQYIQAYPVLANDNSLGTEAKEIVQAIKDEAHRLFNEYNKNPTIDNKNKIEQFFRKLIHVGDNNSTLFQGVAITTPKGIININIPRTNNVILIFPNARTGENGGVKVGIGGKENIEIGSKEFKDILDKILDNLKFRFSYSYFASDNNTNTFLNGIATRKNGKFVITVGEKSWEFDSFNDFVLKQNIVRINTKPNKAGNSNFTRGFNRNSNVNQSLKVNIVSDTSSPVENKPQQAQTPRIQQPVSINDKVEQILNSDSKNKGVDIIEALIGTDALYTKETLEAFKKLRLLPKNIIFDPEFNNKYPTANANYNPRTKTVTVGTKWLDSFKNPIQRNQAIRKLIHEQIHALLRENKKRGENAINSIKQIYDEFKNALDNKEVQDVLTKVGLNVEHLKAYLFENNPTTPTELDKLEEFLVESLTSAELAKALNNIKAKRVNNRRGKTLFQKIMEFLSNLFGWGITKGSLYEKELYTIQRLNLSETNNTKQEAPSLFDDAETQGEGVAPVENKPEVQQEVQPTTQVDETPSTPEVQQTPTETPKPTIEQPQAENKEKQFGERQGRSRRERSRFSSVNEELNNNYTDEMNEIKNSAIANGTFMKAPNGNPTNLNERQWLQVRTKNFINWFGDWINNPDKASKVVDENGEPKVMYHSTTGEFTTFDTDNPRVDYVKWEDGSITYDIFSMMRSGMSYEEAQQLADEHAKGIRGTFIYGASEREVSRSYAPTIYEEFDKYEQYIESNIESWSEQDSIAEEQTIAEIEDVILDRDNYNHLSKERIDEINLYKLADNPNIESFEDAKWYKKDITIEEYNKIIDFKNNYLIPNINKFMDKFSGNYSESYKRQQYMQMSSFLLAEAIYNMKPLEKKTYENPIDLTDENYDDIYGTEFNLFFNIKNPLIVDGKGHNWNEIEFEGNIESTRSLEEIAENRGNDGVIVKNIYDLGGFAQMRMGTPTQSTIVSARKANQVKSASNNTGEFSTTNDDIRFSSVDEELTDNKIKQIKDDCQRFLNNFGININDYSLPEINERFDKLNKVIYANNVNDIIDGTGEAVAFMMQHSTQFYELLALNRLNNPLALKGIRRAVKRNSNIYLETKFTNMEERNNAIEQIGKDIATELRKFYKLEDINSESNSFISKIWELIKEFFNFFNSSNKTKFSVIHSNIKNIVNNIVLNDDSIINFSNTKPGTNKTTNRVDFAKALIENPYEQNIINILNSYGIAIAGSASLAVFGTLYRPNENPLHDIDFQASKFKKSEIENILRKEFGNIYNTNTILQKDGHTETYIVLDRPFKIEFSKNSPNKIIDAETNEVLGTYLYSELELKDGVKGKMLDFFLGNTAPYGVKKSNINGKEYLFTDPRNVLLAKINWRRNKDIWDYNKYISNEQQNRLEEQRKQESRELKNRINDSNIIWGHPAIGKTYYLQNNKDKIIEWDEEVNPRRNKFIKEQIDPDNKLSKEEYTKKKQDYMANIEQHPEYVDFLTKEWNNLKNKAKRENKKIFASPLPLLKLFPNDFDLIINLKENEFYNRNNNRGGKPYSTRSWKIIINETVSKLDRNKVLNTSLYFSDILNDDTRFSSIDELASDVPSVSSFTERLPVQQQAKFASLVARGRVSTSCR